MHRPRVRGVGRGGIRAAVNTGDGPGAYRDDRLSLAAENARLRSEVERLHGVRRARWQRALVALALLAVDAWVFTLVVGWINAPRDGAVWLGLGVATVTVGLNVVVAQRVLRSRG
jgi:hypothetical protein